MTNQPYFSLERLREHPVQLAERRYAQHALRRRLPGTFRAEITGSLNYLTVNDDDVSNHAVILDSLDYTAREYQKPPFTAKTHSRDVRNRRRMAALNLVKLNASLRRLPTISIMTASPQFVENVVGHGR